MAKRHFRITVGGLVHELKIDAVSREFLEYWKDREEDLLEVIQYREEDADDHPEEMLPYYEHWSEADGVCGYYGIGLDEVDEGRSVFEVQEVKLHSDIEVVDGELQSKGEVAIWGDDRFELLGESKEISGISTGTSDQMFWTDGDKTEHKLDSRKPIIIFHEISKGYLGQLFVEIEDGDFDSEKFQYSYVQTSAGDIIVDWMYDLKKLTLENEQDTMGKYFDCMFGYMDISE